MFNPLSHRHQVMALGGLAAMLALLVAGELIGSAADGTAAPQDANRAPPLPGAARPQVDVDTLVATVLARPLFTAGREPPPAPILSARAIDAPKPPVLKSRLAGTVITPDDKEALFAPATGKPTSVGLGATIDGWTVKAIEPDRVVLASAFGEQTVMPSKAVRVANTLTLGRRAATAPAPADRPTYDTPAYRNMNTSERLLPKTVTQ